MRLVTYRPLYAAQPARPRYAYSPLARLHEDMNRLFEQSLGQLEEVASEIQEFAPSLDVDQDEDKYSIALEIPGVRREDVSVETREDALVISGTKNRKPKEEGSENVQSSRQYGRFVQSLSLPDDADRENISAEFADGVLTVTVPRDKERDQKRTRQIEVRAGESSSGDEGGQQRLEQDGGQQGAERASSSSSNDDSSRSGAQDEQQQKQQQEDAKKEEATA